MTSHDTAGRLIVRQSVSDRTVGSTRRRSSRIRTGGRAVAIVGATLIWAAAFAGTVSADPPGNNGTIKVDAAPFDTHPNNEPHVDCVFQIDFYGFDQGDLWADVIFEAHPPTGSGTLLTDRVFIGEDSNAGGGSTAGLDAQKTYDLTVPLQAFAAHPQQGYHVKLTVHADGSQGADTKHKVFWVSGCQPSTAPPPPPPPGGGTSGSNPPPPPPSNPPGGGTAGTPPVRGGTLPNQGGPAGGNLPNTSVPAPEAVTSLIGLALVAVTLSVAMGVHGRQNR